MCLAEHCRTGPFLKEAAALLAVDSLPPGSGRRCAGWRPQMRMGRGKAEGEVWLAGRENIAALLLRVGPG